jgi:exodeoxyribonuclease VII small subunit
MKKPNSFEDALRGLEDIVSSLEEGEVGLEQSLEKYREGVKLHQYCQDRLKRVETELMKVLSEEDEKSSIPGTTDVDLADTESASANDLIDSNGELPF